MYICTVSFVSQTIPQRGNLGDNSLFHPWKKEKKEKKKSQSLRLFPRLHNKVGKNDKNVIQPTIVLLLQHNGLRVSCSLKS